MDEVDAFVRRVAASIDGTDVMTCAEVEAIRFTPRRFREAYDMADVDAWLDAVAARCESASLLR